VKVEPIFALVYPDHDRLLAEAESLDALLLAAATLQEDGQSLDGVVVLKAGEYDPATTALVAERML
jgi:hypothetical protein